MLPQPDLLFAEDHTATSGRQVLPMVGAADLGPTELLGVPDAPLVRAPIDVFQRTDSAAAFSPSTEVSEVAAVSEPSLTAAAATASPSPALARAFDSRTTCFVPARQGPSADVFLHNIAFGLNISDWTPVAI